MKAHSNVYFACLFLIMTAGCSENDVKKENPTNGKTTAVFNPALTYGTMTDQDGNTYRTITIGGQTWMAENLRTTRYNDGTPIPHVTGETEWADLTTGAYSSYRNTDNDDIIATYGRLYNWYAVNTGKLAPKGWHVPTEDEWIIMMDHIGASNTGGKLKETGITHWKDQNTDATNASGFTGVPAGSRFLDGLFKDIGRFGNWWTATESSPGYGVTYYIYYYYNYVSTNNFNEHIGYSVRCVKD